jgi:hypothetical protein
LESARNGKESVVESRDGSASLDCALRGPTFRQDFLIRKSIYRYNPYRRERS